MSQTKEPLELEREFSAEELIEISKQVNLSDFCENIKTNDGYYQIDYSANLVEKKGKTSIKMIHVTYNGTLEEYLKNKRLRIVSGKRFILIGVLK